jgi:hypothetical protein
MMLYPGATASPHRKKSSADSLIKKPALNVPLGTAICITSPLATSSPIFTYSTLPSMWTRMYVKCVPAW